MGPHLGAGVGMGLENAVTLGFLIARAEEVESLEYVANIGTALAGSGASDVQR